MPQDKHLTDTDNSAAVPHHYYDIVDIIPTAAFIKDVNGVYLHCNKAFEFVAGVAKEAIIGRTAFDLFTREVAQQFHEEDREALQGPGVRNSHSFEQAQGGFADTEYVKTPLKDGSGAVVGVMGVITASAQRRMVDEVLQRYELLLKQTRDYIWLIDPADCRILEANQAACQEYGYSRAEFREMHVYDLRADDAKEVVDGQFAQAREKGILFETNHCRKDGSVIPVQVNMGGARVGGRDVVVSITRDISETVKARTELKQQNEYLSVLHETALALINRLDTDDLLDQIIARTATLAGTENAFIFILDPGGDTVTVKAGTGVCARFIGHQFTTGAGLNAEIIASGGTVVVNDYKQWPRRLDDPRLGWIESIMGAPLKSKDRITGVIGFIGTDAATRFGAKEVRLVEGFANLASLALNNAALYGRLQDELQTSKAYEEELTARNADLAEMLHRLQETQLQMVQQEKLAGIGQLAAGVAHEINNPLGFVLSNFESLQKYMSRLVQMIDAYRDLNRRVAAEGGGALREAAQAVEALEGKNRLDYILADLTPILAETTDGINRVGEIVKALRLFSRVDQQDVYEEYDLNAGIRNTLTVARNEIKYVAQVEEDLGELPTIDAFGGRINQVLLNILLNAAQAIAARPDQTQGIIRIRSWGDDQYVYCSVEDNGTGIPEEIKKDIFNPFFTTKPVGKGTGLGLSVSYDIVVNKHRGSLLVDSTAGEGTVFTVKLPIKQSDLR